MTAGSSHRTKKKGIKSERRSLKQLCCSCLIDRKGNRCYVYIFINYTFLDAQLPIVKIAAASSLIFHIVRPNPQ